MLHAAPRVAVDEQRAVAGVGERQREVERDKGFAVANSRTGNREQQRSVAGVRVQHAQA